LPVSLSSINLPDHAIVLRRFIVRYRVGKNKEARDALRLNGNFSDLATHAAAPRMLLLDSESDDEAR
jgi:hypothetical protein